MEPLAVILIGPPISGKSTIARVYASDGYTIVSTGELLRANALPAHEVTHAAERMSAGALVADNIMINLVRRKLAETSDHRFIFDGFPRTVPQAIALDEMLAEIGVPKKRIIPVLIEVSYNKLEYNHLARTHNMRINGEPPRADDDPLVFWKRVEDFHKGLSRLSDYYGRRMQTIDGDQMSRERLSQIKKIIRPVKIRERLSGFLRRGRRPLAPQQ